MNLFLNKIYVCDILSNHLTYAYKLGHLSRRQIHHNLKTDSHKWFNKFTNKRYKFMTPAPCYDLTQIFNNAALFFFFSVHSTGHIL